MFTWSQKYANKKIKLKLIVKPIKRPLPILYESERIAEANPQCALDVFARKLK